MADEREKSVSGPSAQGTLSTEAEISIELPQRSELDNANSNRPTAANMPTPSPKQQQQRGPDTGKEDSDGAPKSRKQLEIEKILRQRSEEAARNEQRQQIEAQRPQVEEQYKQQARARQSPLTPPFSTPARSPGPSPARSPQVKKVKTNISGAKTNISEAKTNISEAKTNIIDAKTNISNAKTKISDAKTNTSNAKTKISDAKTKSPAPVAKSTQQISPVNSSLPEPRQQPQQQPPEPIKDSVEIRMRKLEHDLEQVKTREARLVQELETLRQIARDNNECQVTLSKAMQTIQTLEKEIKEFKGLSETYRCDLDHTKTKLVETDSRLHEMNLKLDQSISAHATSIPSTPSTPLINATPPKQTPTPMESLVPSTPTTPQGLSPTTIALASTLLDSSQMKDTSSTSTTTTTSGTVAAIAEKAVRGATHDQLDRQQPPEQQKHQHQLEEHQHQHQHQHQQQHQHQHQHQQQHQHQRQQHLQRRRQQQEQQQQYQYRRQQSQQRRRQQQEQQQQYQYRRQQSQQRRRQQQEQQQRQLRQRQQPRRAPPTIPRGRRTTRSQTGASRRQSSNTRVQTRTRTRTTTTSRQKVQQQLRRSSRTHLRPRGLPSPRGRAVIALFHEVERRPARAATRRATSRRRPNAPTS